MNIKWQDLQEKINHNHKVYRGKKKKEVGNFTSELTFKCDSATQTLDSNRKNLVNENGFFPFPVLIFMQSQWNNPNSFFPTLNIFLFCSRGLLTARYFTGPLNKQRMTIEKKKNYLIETKNLFFLYPLTHTQPEKSAALVCPLTPRVSFQRVNYKQMQKCRPLVFLCIEGFQLHDVQLQLQLL